MNLGKAVAIFCNIFNSESTKEEKIKAVKIVIEGGMPFNSITKQEYVNALVWIFENYDFDKGE